MNVLCVSTFDGSSCCFLRNFVGWFCSTCEVAWFSLWAIKTVKDSQLIRIFIASALIADWEAAKWSHMENLVAALYNALSGLYSVSVETEKGHIFRPDAVFIKSVSLLKRFQPSFSLNECGTWIQNRKRKWVVSIRVSFQNETDWNKSKPDFSEPRYDTKCVLVGPSPSTPPLKMSSVEQDFRPYSRIEDNWFKQTDLLAWMLCGIWLVKQVVSNTASWRCQWMDIVNYIKQKRPWERTRRHNPAWWSVVCSATKKTIYSCVFYNFLHRWSHINMLDWKSGVLKATVRCCCPQLHMCKGALKCAALSNQ